MTSAPDDTQHATRDDGRFVSTAGLLCLVGAIIGAAGGLAMILVSPSVAPERFSYPFDDVGHVVVESVFLLNHGLLLVGLLGVTRSGATGDGRLGRAGIGVAATGMVLLSVCEVMAMVLVDAMAADTAVGWLGAAYGLATVTIGVGLVMAGIAVARARVWRGWARFVVLTGGVAVFVVVLPGVAGPMVIGRLVLIAWMLVFAALGFALLRSRPSIVLANTVDVAAPIEDVFDYLSDLRNEQTWNPKMKAVELLTAEPVGAGSRYRARWAGSGDLTVEYLDYLRPTSWASTAPGTPMTVDFAARLTPLANGTHCDFRMEIVPHGAMVLLAPVLAGWLQRQEATNMRYLKARCESPPRRPRSSCSKPRP